MAITHERVTLSQVNFEMFKFDYTDINNLNVPIITNFTSFDDVPIMNRYNVYAQMLMNGIDNMPLYDNQQNVIGSLSVDQYKIEYVTAQVYTATYLPPGEYGVDEQTSDSAYPAYQASTSTTTYIGGVQFRRVTSAIGGVPVRFKANLNGHDMYHAFDYPNIITLINDINGYWPAERVKHLLLTPGGFGSTSVGLMTRTRSGVTTTYLEFVYLNSDTGFDYGVTGTWDYETLVADNLNITDYIVQEEGYVNELMNRFSPRYWSNMTGIYVIPESTMNDLAEGLVQQNLSDWLNRAFFGSDGKQYIMAFRWYYGLLDSIQKTADLHNINFGVGSVTLGALGQTPVQAKVATREFAVWQTSEMSVMPHFDNYLDMLSTYELYLPYYGFLNIDPNDIVGGTIQVFYNINLVTGTANINVVCKTARTGNLKTKSYTLNAQVGIEIPFGADMLKEMTTAWAQTCGKAFATGASMGLGMSGQGFGDIVGQAEGAMNAIASNPDITEDERATALNNAKAVQDSARNSQSVVNVAQHAMNTMSNTTPALSPVIRSGGTSNESGSLDELFPYLLITRPMSAAPSNYEEYVGMPSYKSANLGSISGFTKVAAIKPSSMANAPKYLDEIIAQLKAGVYL